NDRRARLQGDRRGDAAIPRSAAVDSVAHARSSSADVGGVLATTGADAARRPRPARPRCTSRDQSCGRRRLAGESGREWRRPITDSGAGPGIAYESTHDSRVRGGRAMKLRDLLRGVPVRALHGNDDADVSSVTADSRLVKPGALFVAIPGTAMDGAKFIPQAEEKGAVVIVTSSPSPREAGRGARGEGPVVEVDDAREALALIAANFYGNPATKLDIVGVTGTSGKTTTTKMIESIFDATNEPVGLIGTIEYRAGEERLSADRTTPD